MCRPKRRWPRSIPACAGETRVDDTQGVLQSVYPRVCGGNGHGNLPSRIGYGLSPRVRGKLQIPLDHVGFGRSIPACAGETVSAQTVDTYPEVYPRVCGGNGKIIRQRVRLLGLSPRVRGKPGGELMADWNLSVYPRVCGGNPRGSPGMSHAAGLSPRVRGKRAAAAIPKLGNRSIPACAGETNGFRVRNDRQRVYPRVCGGNWAGCKGCFCWHGLSPRVRGKPWTERDTIDWLRSIPACAGETGGVRHFRTPEAVYPRVCGGNARPSSRARFRIGLSPRVRGKPSPTP